MLISSDLFAAALFFIEVRVNTKLLGPAMTGGESEGQGISFAVAAYPLSEQNQLFVKSLISI